MFNLLGLLAGVASAETPVEVLKETIGEHRRTAQETSETENGFVYPNTNTYGTAYSSSTYSNYYPGTSSAYGSTAYGSGSAYGSTAYGSGSAYGSTYGAYGAYGGHYNGGIYGQYGFNQDVITFVERVTAPSNSPEGVVGGGESLIDVNPSGTVGDVVTVYNALYNAANTVEVGSVAGSCTFVADNLCEGSYTVRIYDGPFRGTVINTDFSFVGGESLVGRGTFRASGDFVSQTGRGYWSCPEGEDCTTEGGRYTFVAAHTKVVEVEASSSKSGSYGYGAYGGAYGSYRYPSYSTYAYPSYNTYG